MTFEVWFGHDTFGRMVEVARECGSARWFARCAKRGRFGKWFPHEPTWRDRVPNPNAKESEPLGVDPFIAWGFQRLHKVGDDVKGLRLPGGPS